ncbi:MAG: bifunctional riboflavin kinase/FAD synthetase [Chlamydiae bacterium]|nr:bifunctional riboflavin kinase/FAD synthetase [Chlamydiota bacterium]MBI3265762.1 bifunctional riboflavin kinase/FAD synthetase [Chlamydiota bacterium]
MRIVRGLEHLGEVPSPLWMTLGNFDGVHLGHQVILERLIENARNTRAQAGVVSFDPHPRKILKGSDSLQLITSMEHRLRLLAKEGVDLVLILPFDKAFSQITARSFLIDKLFKNLFFKGLVIGENYAFGKDRQGNVELLKSLGVEFGFCLDQVLPVKIGSEMVSSTLIRRFIQEGDFKRSSEMLGRPFSFFSSVIKGSGLGKRIGFPTANLNVEDMILPPGGVYRVEVGLGEKEKHLGVANIGTRPTVSQEGKNHFEVHLFDFDQNIYGKSLEVFLIEKIRNERRFGSLEELRQQIARDCENVRNKFLHIS